MKVYKLEKNESERDVRVTAGGAVYRTGVEGPRSSKFAASFSRLWVLLKGFVHQMIYILH